VAATACRAGHVRAGNKRGPAKPAHPVRAGDRVAFFRDGLTRVLQVHALPNHRLPARSVGRFATDVTPPEELARAAEAKKQARQNDNFANAEHAGRPTKRERRIWESLIRPKGR
jgi:ribosome-associated heat shock protein Hsp15